jgi:signal transduction histidine kinase
MVATGFVLIGVDTTERKLHEQKLLEMNQELEAQYEIFKELNLKLNDANKIAEESSRLKSLLLSNLSHEVRTPMNAIIGFSDLMQKETNEEKKLQFSGIISKSAKQLLQTIDDIVFVSKLQSQKQTLNITNVYLLGIINECVLMRQFEKQKQDTPLNIVYDKTNENFTFKTDENKLKQILTNLISNAFNYTQQGKIDVGFYTEENHIILFVKDTGIGIPFEEKDRVYDIFFRGESSNALAIRGLGLGLSIVKELVNVLQGTVWFESEVNKGTTFFVKLPVKHY